MIYLSAPMSARFAWQERRNVRRMLDKARELRALGLTVYCPPENEPANKSWSFYLAIDTDWIYQNNPKVFYFMRGWQRSKGSQLEHEIALQLGATIVYEI